MTSKDIFTEMNAFMGRIRAVLPGKIPGIKKDKNDLTSLEKKTELAGDCGVRDR